MVSLSSVSIALNFFNFSLGAHIAGRAAKLLKSLQYNIGRLACIIGLDPASVGFNYINSDKRLAIADADYVQVIHTDTSKFGIPYPIGHGMFSLVYLQLLQK